MKEALNPRHLTTFVATWDAHGLPTCLGWIETIPPRHLKTFVFMWGTHGLATSQTCVATWDAHGLPICLGWKETLSLRHLKTFVFDWDAHGLPTCLDLKDALGKHIGYPPALRCKKYLLIYSLSGSIRGSSGLTALDAIDKTNNIWGRHWADEREFMYISQNFPSQLLIVIFFVLCIFCISFPKLGIGTLIDQFLAPRASFWCDK